MIISIHMFCIISNIIRLGFFRKVDLTKAHRIATLLSVQSNPHAYSRSPVSYLVIDILFFAVIIFVIDGGKNVNRISWILKLLYYDVLYVMCCMFSSGIQPLPKCILFYFTSYTCSMSG